MVRVCVKASPGSKAGDAPHEGLLKVKRRGFGFRFQVSSFKFFFPRDTAENDTEKLSQISAYADCPFLLRKNECNEVSQ